MSNFSDNYTNYQKKIDLIFHPLLQEYDPERYQDFKY